MRSVAPFRRIGVEAECGVQKKYDFLRNIGDRPKPAWLREAYGLIRAAVGAWIRPERRFRIRYGSESPQTPIGELATNRTRAWGDPDADGGCAKRPTGGRR